jgi:hypothetical protein
VPDLGKVGVVYILSHPAFTAWTKIGFTTIDVAQRAKDYSKGHEFDEQWSIPTLPPLSFLGNCAALAPIADFIARLYRPR